MASANTHSPTAGVFITLPPSDFFALPPRPFPESLYHPAPASFENAPPFSIPKNLYTAVLDVRVPIAIAATYAITAKSLNIYNTSTGKRPWAISKTRAFKAFVVLHNIFLAVYSAWTFVGMLRCMMRSTANPFGPDGLAGTVDSLCKMHGPRGLDGAVSYDEPFNTWTFSMSKNANDVVTPDGLPKSKEPGRIWNEGLAFYGWIFYMSKFYEVLDTFIILAKGKLSSTLQTYHHAGAMMAMWAGMRYMSAPIWMFALVNSFIHTLMVSRTWPEIRVPC